MNSFFFGNSICINVLNNFLTDFITFLLQRIGTYIDPRILVARIESNLEIPGLKKSLVKMMQDYNLQVNCCIYF